jgi:hypothetical protein
MKDYKYYLICLVLLVLAAYGTAKMMVASVRGLR